MRARRHRPEDAIQRAIAQHGHQRGARGVFMFSIPNGGLRSKAEAAIMKGTGTVAGMPDLCFVKNGRAYFLELKAPGGHLTPVQQDVLLQLRECGAVASHVHGLDQALAWLEAHGLLKGTTQ